MLKSKAILSLFMSLFLLITLCNTSYAKLVTVEATITQIDKYFLPCHFDCVKVGIKFKYNNNDYLTELKMYEIEVQNLKIGDNIQLQTDPEIDGTQILFKFLYNWRKIRTTEGYTIYRYKGDIK